MVSNLFELVMEWGDLIGQGNFIWSEQRVVDEGDTFNTISDGLTSNGGVSVLNLVNLSLDSTSLDLTTSILVHITAQSPEDPCNKYKTKSKTQGTIDNDVLVLADQSTWSSFSSGQRNWWVVNHGVCTILVNQVRESVLVFEFNKVVFWDTVPR
jgi:hypothetical protein